MKNKFSWRAFISFGLSYAIIILLLSGIMLYVAPAGRYAHWVNWTLWGFSKEGWQEIHIIFSLGFVLLSILHLLWINWKAFVSYIKSKKSSGFNKKWELISSTLLIVVFFFGTIYAVPPFKNILDFGEQVTASWEKIEERAPVPHAELLTLAELGEQLNMQVDEITRKLDKHKIKYENISKQSMQEIAETNNSTPLEIYEVISKKADNQMQGSGIGRKTVEDFAAELGKSVDEVMKIFKVNDIEAKPTQTLRAIGENNNLPPRDVYKLISE
jgi:hypothetical protein